MNKFISCTVFSVIVVTSSASSELKNCNGIWTNKPCEAGVQAEIAEATKAPPRSREAIEMDRKRLWLQEIETKRFNAERQYGLVFDMKSVRDVCLDTSAALEQCRSMVDERTKDLEAKITETLKQRKLEEDTQKPTPAQIPNVTIINQQNQTRVETHVTVEKKVATPTPKSNILVGDGIDIGIIGETKKPPIGFKK